MKLPGPVNDRRDFNSLSPNPINNPIVLEDELA